MARQHVRPDPASFSGFPPFPLDPALLFEAVQCRKKRPRLYLKSSMRDLGDAICNGRAVHRAQSQRAQDKQVERTFEEFEGGRRHLL